MRAGLLIGTTIATFISAACARSEEGGQREEAGEVTPAAEMAGAHAHHEAAADTSAPAMPGMDHDTMDMTRMNHGRSNAQPGATHGPEHGQPEAGGAAPHPHAGMQGMDHAPSQPRGATPVAHAAQMDHRRTGSAGQRNAAESATHHRDMRGTEHAGMPSDRGTADHAAAAPSPVDAEATKKLKTLAAELLRDPFVQQRIRSDPALRQRWENEATRRQLGRPPR